MRRPRSFLAFLVVCLCLASGLPGGGDPARAAGLDHGDGERPAVILLAAGVGGQKELAPLVQALKVGGYAVTTLAPDPQTGGLPGLAQRLGQALESAPGAGRLALVAHGAGGLAAMDYLRGQPAGRLERALFIALPVGGIPPLAGDTPCAREWRDRVTGVYGPEILAQAAPGAPLVRALAQDGLPLAVTVQGIAGRLEPAVANGLVTLAGCGAKLAQLPGDGVVHPADLEGLPGFGRDDRAQTVPGDHLGLAGQRVVVDLVLAFLRQPPRRGSAAVSLVMDGSGSIKSVDQQGLRQEAASLLISRLQPGDVISVESFNTQAKSVLAPTLIRSGAQAAQVAARLPKLPAGGDTDIGAGLRLAGEQLLKSPVRQRLAVLMTDGRNDPESANGPTLETVRALVAQGVVVHTVGLTDQVDELFLASLASEGGGRYFRAADPAELVAVFDRLQGSLDGRALLYRLQAKGPQTLELPVDSSVRRLEFNLFAPPSTELRLTDPQGATVTPAVARGRTYTTRMVAKPTPGVWRVTLEPADGAEYLLQVTADTELTAGLAAAWPPQEGRPWRYSLRVEQEGLPLAQCQAQVELRLPGGKVLTKELKPAPSKGFSSGASSAGPLTGNFDGLDQPGDAQLTALVTGLNQRGEAFQRMISETVHVSDQRERGALLRTLRGQTPRWGDQP